MKDSFTKLVCNLISVALLMLSGIGTAHAVLIDKGDYIFDDNSGLLWSKHDIQIDYSLTAAFDRIDALNASNALVDVNDDGYLDSLVWSLAPRDFVRGLYDSYSLTERTTAFGAGNRAIFYTPRLRYSGSWTQLLGGWSTADLFGTGDIFQVQSGWGNQRECFMLGGCSLNIHDGFLGGFRTSIESGLWASSTVNYGGTVPVPATLLLLGAGVLGLVGSRAAKSLDK